MNFDEVKNAVVEDTLYSLIAEKYWTMSKDELKDILLETLYAVHSTVPYFESDVLAEMLNGLNDRWCE